MTSTQTGRLVLGGRILVAAFLIWRTWPLLPDYKAAGVAHDVPGWLILLIALWEIGAAILFAIPKTVLWGGLGLLGVFVLAAGVSIHAGTGFFQLLVYALVVLAFLYLERRARAGPKAAG